MENRRAPVVEKTAKEKPVKVVRPVVRPDDSKRGCATSFLTNKRGEMDELCGVDPAKNPKEKEYVQPDEEKEAGGES
jgi:hypothetical protein